ncbi:MAG: hypothetical protein PHF60_02960 [Candidatus ainarchaeum sp.]|nr:hypothetical protein [Candidatus ainarchaeum sp.]
MDFTLGLTALVFIMMLYVLMWDTIAMRWNSAGQHTQMEASAFFASESLLATPGEPESWEMLPHIDTNVSAIGLVNGRNELNRMKLEKLVSENATGYPSIKARLGMQRYEFGMRVTDLEGNNIYYEFGKFSSGSLNNSVNFDRFGMLDDEPVIVHMEVWGK